MRVTVIFEDGTIVVNNSAINGFVFPDIDTNWRVIQWLDDCGWIEVFRGERIWLSDVQVVQPYIEMWTVKKTLADTTPSTDPNPPPPPEEITT